MAVSVHDLREAGHALSPDGRFLEACRLKRNTFGYQQAGAATADEAAQLTQLTSELRKA